MASLMTPEQVRVRLGLTSIYTVYRWARDGRLPSIRLSARAIRFRSEDVDRFIDQHAG